MRAPRKRSKSRHGRTTNRHAQLGQHFFRSGSIARRIVRSLGLRKDQSVLELGAGRGFFTNLLAAEVSSVTAIDIDPRLVARLCEQFKSSSNVRIVHKSITSTIDFGDYDVVFGNIPFNRTADIFRKLSRPPARFKFCHLIVQSEAAYRLVGAGRPTELAVLAYPFIEVDIGLNIPRWAYDPPTSVDRDQLLINQ